MSRSDGIPIVLTADRTLMADYGTLFDGMIAASQTTTTPRPILTGLLAPRAHRPVAPMGLRRVEAALRRDGFSAADVAIVPHEEVHQVIGPATRLIGISAGEILGWGMNSTTMTAITGGEIYAARLVHALINRIHSLRDNAPQARVVVGGPGAWQLVEAEQQRRSLGIDHVITGEVEGNIGQMFQALGEGVALPVHIEGEPAAVETIPAVCGATVMGVVELSRGCGLGCGYCTMGRIPMRHLPRETILADVDTNLAAGLTGIAFISEDMLRYGGTGARPDPEALLSLLRDIRAMPGVGLIQTDHANMVSVAAYSDEQLRELRELMVGETGCRFPWLNLGVETPCGELLARNGSAKLGDVDPAAWGDFCATELRRLIAAGFMPMASLIMCLPGETEAHVRAALDWVESLADEPLTIFPVLYAPIDGAAPPDRAALTRLHWRLLQRCYDINFREVPRMLWDNQAAVGTPLLPRIALQVLGRGRIVQWRSLFAWHRWRARR